MGQFKTFVTTQSNSNRQVTKRSGQKIIKIFLTNTFFVISSLYLSRSHWWPFVFRRNDNGGWQEEVRSRRTVGYNVS